MCASLSHDAVVDGRRLDWISPGSLSSRRDRAETRTPLHLHMLPALSIVSRVMGCGCGMPRRRGLRATAADGARARGGRCRRARGPSRGRGGRREAHLARSAAPEMFSSIIHRVVGPAARGLVAAPVLLFGHHEGLPARVLRFHACVCAYGKCGSGRRFAAVSALGLQVY